MSDSDEPRRPRQEILPPVSRTITSAPEVSTLPQGFLGMAIFARARYASEQKQVEAYHRLVNAKNALLQALNTQQGLAIEYAIVAEQLNNIDVIRAAARTEVHNRLAAVRAAGELDQLRFDSEKERLLLERDQYRQRRDRLNTPPAPPRPKESTAEAIKKVGDEIEEIEQAYARLREDFIAKAGGEGNLTEQDRQRLGNFQILRDSLLNDVMGALQG
jgi:hypothetical protein